MAVVKVQGGARERGELIRLRADNEALRAELEELKKAVPLGAREFMEFYRNKAVELARQLGAIQEDRVGILNQRDHFNLKLTCLKVAVLKANKLTRDPGDKRYGNPCHAHTKRGKWDRDGSVCESCKAWDEMLKMARAK